MPREAPNMHPANWRRVPGHLDYEVDRFGNVRSWKPVGKNKVTKPRYLKPFLKKRKQEDPRRWFYIIKLDGKEIKLARVVWSAWHGPVPKGYGVAHKNLDRKDDNLNNLMLMSKSEYGRHGTLKQSYGGGVTAVKRNGEIVAFYKSARDVSRKLPISYQAVLDRCNRTLKRDEYTLLGFTFRWTDRFIDGVHYSRNKESKGGYTWTTI